MASDSNSSTSTVASEDELGQKWDRCIADSILKTGTGFGLGLVFSLLLFKRRPWPIALGTGYGLGYAVSNCQHDFRRVNTVHLRPIELPEPSQSSPPPTSKEVAAEDTASPPTSVAPPTQTKVETETSAQEKS